MTPATVAIPASQLPAPVRAKLTKSEAAKAGSAQARVALEQAKARARQFKMLCHAVRLPLPALEYQFTPERNWRFDFAWPDVDGTGGLALECDGGVFVRGRHARGAGILKTHEKLNAAAVLGWRVLYTTPAQLCTDATVDLVTRALVRRAVEGGG